MLSDEVGKKSRAKRIVVVHRNRKTRRLRGFLPLTEGRNVQRSTLSSFQLASSSQSFNRVSKLRRVGMNSSGFILGFQEITRFDTVHRKANQMGRDAFHRVRFFCVASCGRGGTRPYHAVCWAWKGSLIRLDQPCGESRQRCRDLRLDALPLRRQSIEPNGIKLEIITVTE